MNNYYIVGDSIEHHGILGQKWGVRRYQNEDGSYTSAGKAHLKKEVDPNSFRGHIKTTIKSYGNAIKANNDRRNAYRNRSEMTNSEMAAYMNRIRAENEFKRLVKENTETDFSKQLKQAMVGVAVGATTTAVAGSLTSVVRGARTAKAVYNSMPKDKRPNDYNLGTKIKDPRNSEEISVGKYIAENTLEGTTNSVSRYMDKLANNKIDNAINNIGNQNNNQNNNGKKKKKNRH